MNTWLLSQCLSLAHGRVNDNLPENSGGCIYRTDGKDERLAEVYSPRAMVSESIEMTIGFESSIIQAVKGRSRLWLQWPN